AEARARALLRDPQLSAAGAVLFLREVFRRRHVPRTRLTARCHAAAGCRIRLSCADARYGIVIGNPFRHNLAGHRRAGGGTEMTETVERARLAQLEQLGSAVQCAGRIHSLIAFSPLFENFNLPEVSLLTEFMQFYRTETGAEILREG